ncbi:MAG: hypothetical protein NTY76_05710 [Candidatus Omnitrophica bacterium]|nr:hypothetical protein [Candidatus Omnitrophota bacterium]
MIRYKAFEETESNLIERTITTTDSFDTHGNAVQQTSKTYVLDSASGEMKLQKSTLVENININNHGDAATQHITTSQTDSTVVTYQVIENHSYDPNHNATSQEILTYTQEGGTLLDVQEIRSMGFTSSGVASQQNIITYSDAAKTDIIDVKVVENKNIDSLGHVGDSVVTRYSSASIDPATGVITPANAIDLQAIHTEKNDFDLRGNALIQTITKSWYDNGVLKFSEAQVIKNAPYDLHDRATQTSIYNYKDEAMTDFSQVQVITYGAYDKFGNSVAQTINSYSDANKTELIDHKVIENNFTVYDASGAIDQAATDKAERRGNARLSTVKRYTSTTEDNTTLIEKTMTATDSFDDRGNALIQTSIQTSETYVLDSEGKLKLQKSTTVENIGIDNRGDAGLQHITTSETDSTGTRESLEVTSYQVIENRSFDPSHNVTNQRIITYTDATKSELKDVQEIRSEGFTSSGTAGEQIIATYATYVESTKTVSDFIEAKVITNNDISLRGNVGKSTITTYSAATLESGNGNIVLSDVSAVTKQTIITTRFDLRGNSGHHQRGLHRRSL